MSLASSRPLLLRRGRLMSLQGLETVDVLLREGRIAAIEPHSTERLWEWEGLDMDLQEGLVSPPFVESHIHLDSALTAGDPRWNESGTLFEGIEIWRSRKQFLTQEDCQQRALTTLQQLAQQGVLFVRTHADVSESQLMALQGLLAVRDRVRDWMTVQVIAFPQDGIYGAPENERLLERALEMGVDGVGGIPHYEFTREDGVRSVHRIFELAQQGDRLIDIHCDEIDDEQSRFLEVVAACALRTGLGERVTASHTTAFGSYNDAYGFKLMGLLRRSRLNMVANPLINITLQGRTDTYPKRRGLTRVKELWQNGINVSLGHDCVQDPWYNLGTGNPLDVAHMAVHVAQMTGRQEVEACYEMVTTHGARTLQVESDYGVAVGKSANLIVLEGTDPVDVIRRRAIVRLVISRGRILAQTHPPTVEWFDPNIQ